jgi:hypothetical protein
VRRLALLAVLAVATVGAVVLLQEATQTRPDPTLPGSSSTVAFEVTLHGFTSEADPGETLWGACQSSMSSQTTDFAYGEGPHGLRYEATVTPALGEHAARHLEGCLEDATVDRIKGDVLDVTGFDHDGTELTPDLRSPAA